MPFGMYLNAACLLPSRRAVEAPHEAVFRKVSPMEHKRAAPVNGAAGRTEYPEPPCRMLFFAREGQLADTAAQFLGQGFVDGTSVIIVGSASHRARIATQLVKRGFNVVLAQKRGRYCSVDVDAVLQGNFEGGRLNVPKLRK